MSTSAEKWREILTPLDNFRWQIPKAYHPQMKVDGIIYASADLIASIVQDQAPEQVAQVAQLPGILQASLAMPDIHWGYGFAIGGVAAFDAQEGIISPGGVGYDINCGVRLLCTQLPKSEVQPQLEMLIRTLYQAIPAGVGSEGKIHLKSGELKHVLQKGARWAVQKGWGWQEDLERTEDQGCLATSDPEQVSRRALKRGQNQLGTLGSGNHFLEIQVVDEIYHPLAAQTFGLEKGQITVMIHCGSRGLGYQVCDDFLGTFHQASERYKIHLPDRQLVCAPVQSPEGQAYLSAMAAAANYAWANRQCIMHWVRESFEQIFKRPAEKLGLHLVYDVAHNIAKLEEHQIQNKVRSVCVHRKGATRSFPPGHPAVNQRYRSVGQPVLIPGSMGTASYVCVGTEAAMQLSFGSTAHGAGRVLSRHAALRQTRGRSISQELANRGIHVMARERGTLAEEAPEAYKDIHSVVDVVDRAGLSKKVARLLPLGVVKG